jgi:flagellar basal body-associated protein FliL
MHIKIILQNKEEITENKKSRNKTDQGFLILLILLFLLILFLFVFFILYFFILYKLYNFFF